MKKDAIAMKGINEGMQRMIQHCLEVLDEQYCEKDNTDTTVTLEYTLIAVFLFVVLYYTLYEVLSDNGCKSERRYASEVRVDQLQKLYLKNLNDW